MDSIQKAVAIAAEAFRAHLSSTWIVGFSGGKDSSALLKVLTEAAIRTGTPPKDLTLIYCDTGVENPILDRYVMSLFSRLDSEFKNSTKFKTKILKAPITDSFFVKIIGRGYPPPTNSFRWCTKNLRINPVAKYIHDAALGDAIVALGMRSGESIQRDRSIQKNGGDIWQDQAEAKRKYRIFLPILHMTVEDVWEAIYDLPHPLSIDAEALTTLYRGASGECPIVKSPNAPPCASGRFGCWTCTVVRKDKSSVALIEAGFEELRPYNEFRNWLAEFRNDLRNRWPVRRSGAVAPGPFSLSARLEILRRLEELEATTGAHVLSSEERSEIERLWALDAELDAAYL